MDLNSPITLVIRAPNQRVEDHTVECLLGWTVKKLKKHLENVYPSKPKETQQRLIYSGKLLADEMTLKDIIVQNEERNLHTVHLVCSPSVENAESPICKESRPTVVSSSSAFSSPVSAPDGLRQRNHVSNHPVQQNNIVTTTSAPAPNVQTPPMMMPPGPDAALTPEQYMLMMQTYYYQMANQYMQYYQPGAYPVPPSPVGQVNQNEAVAQPNNEEELAARPANQNQVMNAQGGMMDDDDDDEFGQRDWLDYVYTFSRFMVLLSIVYFYSNFTRFLAVAAFFFVVYLYQTGWFALRRRVPQEQNPRNNEEQQNNNPVQQQNIDQQQNEDGANQNVHSADNVDGQQNPDTTQTEQNVTAPDPPKPSVLAVAWCFVSNFFASLIPAPPAPVNAN